MSKLTARLRRLLAFLDALLDRLDRLFERQPGCQVLLGRPAHLAVDDPVGGEILDELLRDTAKALAGLHDGGREIERLQVLHERSGVALTFEPVGEVVGVGRGHVESDVARELDDRLRAHGPVEVIVQRDLGQRAEGDPLQLRVAVLVDGHGFSSGGGGGPSTSSGTGVLVGPFDKLRDRGADQAVMRSRTSGADAGASVPTSHAPSSDSSARSKRLSSSASKVNTG
jgi:hypothetical protein